MSQSLEARGILNQAYCEIQSEVGHLPEKSQARIYRALANIVKAVPEEGFVSTMNLDFIEELQGDAEWCERERVPGSIFGPYPRI